MSAKSPRAPALGFIFVTLLLAMLGGGLVMPVLPGLVTEFEGGNVADGAHWYGWIACAFALMQFVGSPIIGALSDRYGRRRVLLISLAGSSIDYVIMALTPSVGWMLVARMISGLTAAVLATANAYVADVTPPEKRPHAFGMLGAAFGLGLVLGPVIGGLLGQIDLRLPFWAAAGFAALNFAYGLWVLPESLKPENRRAFDWRRANPFGALVALGRFPVVLGLAGTHFVSWVAQTLLHATWVIYTGYRYGWSPRQVGLSFALVGICSALVQAVLVKRILPVLGEQRAIVIGFCLAIAAYVAYGLASQGWMVYAIIVGASFGGIAGPALQSYISRHVPDNEQGSVQGAF
ncbi:MAG: TCR/Tet family MFS transporter, partial [Verrucomicrobia bacterium]|nr:TCR/Tet family MFS transporter [Verrucomicrobiota bacterium]